MLSPLKGWCKGWCRLACVMASMVLVLLSILRYTQTPVVAQVDRAPACAEQLRNGDFETDTDWTLPVTAYRAIYSTEEVQRNIRSLRAGIVNAAENVFSYSSASQLVVIPTDIQTATLAFWWYPVSGEGELANAAHSPDAATVQAAAHGVAPTAVLAGDRQYVLLVNEQNTVLDRLLWTRSDAQSWQRLTFELAAYAGQSVRVLFGVYNDGVDGVTAVFVDDATLVTCAPSAAANYLPIIASDATASSTPTTTPVATPTPSATAVWSAPAQAIEVFSPVQAGLYHSPIVVNGFSQTFEGNVNLRLTDQHGQVLAERHTLGGSVDGFDFFDSYLRFTVSEMISATVEIFETSAMDGSEIHKVSIPVVLLPGQRVIDLNSPPLGAQLCNPVFVRGYSNTFEANVVVTLQLRNGTPLALTTAMGGNLGIYADFSTLISHTVTAPQPILVSAYEVSPAGFGLVDQAVTPIELHPAGSAVCP